MAVGHWLAFSLVVQASIASSWLSLGDQDAIPLTPQPNKGHTLHLTHDLLGLHKNLTQIESITGNEKEVGDWLAQSFHSQGYQVKKQIVSRVPLRFNVLAWPGKTQDAKVLLSSHIDTVPPFYPYKIDDSTSNKTISGRGSVDAKASVATQIIAVNKLLDSKAIHRDDVALLYVVGEETGGDGMRAANDLKLKPESIIFGEPTEGKLASGHKGMLGIKLVAKGKAAHSGYPWLGRSATEVLLAALTAVLELARQLPDSDKFGVTTINVGKIEGGVAANVVAEAASALIAIRIAAGEPQWLRDELTRVVNEAVQPFLNDDQKAWSVIEVHGTSEGYPPVDIDSDVPGFDQIIVNYGTDIPNWKQVHGQKRYLYGPGSIQVAHSDHEMLTEAQLEDAVLGYEKIVLHALGKDDAGRSSKHKGYL